MEAPGLHETNFNTQCYNDAIDLISRWKVRLRHTFFQNEAQKVLYKPVLVSDLGSIEEARLDKVLVPYHKVLVPYDM